MSNPMKEGIASFADLVSNPDLLLRDELAKARECKCAGQIDHAVSLLLRLCKEYPNEKAVHLALGHLYWEKKELARARSCFRKVTQLDPRLEIGSLALFHVLWSSNLKQEALQEAKRFLRVAHSLEYERILRSFKGKS